MMCFKLKHVMCFQKALMFYTQHVLGLDVLIRNTEHFNSNISSNPKTVKGVF